MANLTAAQQQQQVAWKLYRSLECEVQQIVASALPATDPRLLGIRSNFVGLTPDQRVTIGSFIHEFETTRKAFEDAETHSTYAYVYRGAPDDDDEPGDEWRPQFSYFARRRRELLNAMEDLSTAASNLLWQLTLWDLHNSAIEDFLGGYTDRKNANAPKLRAEIDDDHPRWKMEAEGRIEEVERVEKEKLAEEKKLARKRKRAKKDESAREDEEMVDAPAPAPDVGTVDGPPTAPANAPDPAVKWLGSVRLGEGGFGQADLWIAVDDEGTIVERVVRKQCQLQGSLWSEDRFWSNGAPGRSLRTDTVPMEIHALRELANKPGSESVIKILSHKLDLARKKMDIYMEYCPHGDGSDINAGKYGLKRHKDHSDRLMFPYFDYSTTVDMVPEPFIWSAFLSAVTAGLLMERGNLDKQVADPAWSVIVHRDIKLPNMLLGIPNTSRFDIYPQCKMADFGMAVRIPRTDLRPLKKLQYLGTAGHAAPEMHGALKRSDGRAYPQSTKTNVWGVGILIYSLLAGKSGAKQADGTYWFDWNVVAKREPPEFDQSATKKYSAELRNLVLACLRYDAEDRPTFDFLMKEIRKHTGDGAEGDERAAGLRDLTEAAARSSGSDEEYERYRKAVEDHRMALVKVDGYEVGCAVDQVDWWEDVEVQDLEPPDALWELAN